MPIAFSLRHIRKIALIGGCAALAAVAMATLSPIQMRPISALPVSVERFAAFAVVGIAFALALPRRPLLLLTLIVTCAGTLEWLQNVLPDRHGRFEDFLVKASGVVIGVAIGAAANYWIRRMQKPASTIEQG